MKHAILIAAILLPGSSAFAQAPGIQGVIDALEAHGYTGIEVSEPRGGRITVEAHRQDSQRELVYDAHTGHVLSDETHPARATTHDGDDGGGGGGTTHDAGDDHAGSDGTTHDAGDDGGGGTHDSGGGTHDAGDDNGGSGGATHDGGDDGGGSGGTAHDGGSDTHDAGDDHGGSDHE